METSIAGYAYLFTGFTMYLAAAVLLAHSCIALLYIARVLWTQTTSSAWASIPELIVLTQNSRHAGSCFENTEAGIWFLRTFAATSRIVVTEADGEEHLELLWRDGIEAPITEGRIMPNKVY
jgi:hypothetical protein